MERQESMIERRLRQNVATVEQQAARLAALEMQLAEAVLANELNIADAERNVTAIAEGMIDELKARIAELEMQLDAARLLIVAIDENICMSSNPLTYTTRRIVELLRDPARNPWAGLMRAGKEGNK